MNIYSSAESNWSSGKKHSIVSNGEYTSPTKRSRPSLSQRLGLDHDSDQSESEPYSPSDSNLIEAQQRIIREPQASLRESTLISTGQHSKAILELLDDVDDDEDEDEEEAYSPSQLDPATMDEVSHQLKDMTPTTKTQSMNYVPPPTVSHQQDVDYREKKKLTDSSMKHDVNSNHCRPIPVHGECKVVDPRLRIYSTRLRSKVRQLVLDRLPADDLIDRNEILEELDHLVESHGRRFYWYRVICFLQNMSLTNNTPKQTRTYLKEVSKLLVLTPTISKILKIKQKYPKSIPIDSNDQHVVADPRLKLSTKNNFHFKILRYK